MHLYSETIAAYKILCAGTKIRILKSLDINIILGNMILIENASSLEKIKLLSNTIIAHYKKSRNLSIKNYNIGTLYYIVEKYDKMKKYYLKKPNQSLAINNLGYYYKTIEHSDTLAVQYFKRGFILGNSVANSNLLYYYIKCDDTKLLIKCCEDGIKMGFTPLKI
jgi:hypothetical protein